MTKLQKLRLALVMRFARLMGVPIDPHQSYIPRRQGDLT